MKVSSEVTGFAVNRIIKFYTGQNLQQQFKVLGTKSSDVLLDWVALSYILQKGQDFQ